MKSKKVLVAAFFLVLASVVVLEGVYLSKIRLETRKKAAPVTAGWLNHDRSLLKESAWFNDHRYRDCPQTSGGFWPPAGFDCLIPDQLGGPSDYDKTVVAEPDGLYCKHLSPTDFLGLLVPTNKDSWTNRLEVDKALKEALNSKRQVFKTMSVDSLMVGLEGGIDGSLVRSVSLMVHPQLENLILKLTDSRTRVSVLYQPFVEGAIGRRLTFTELEGVNQLYLAALNRCGEHNTDQTGLSQKLDLGNFWAVVQLWSGGDGSGDCNLHLVAK